jgi:hypothetical protein
MKMMPATVYTRFGRICRQLRASGERLDFLRMGLAADLALALEEDDQSQVDELATKLNLDLDTLNGDES